jgi:hypothetical protein
MIRRYVKAMSSAQPLAVPSSVPVSTKLGVWWQLGGRHLLYCGDPNSPEFLERIAEEKLVWCWLSSTSDWQPAIQATTRIVSTEDLPQRKDLRLFEDTLESMLCSDIGGQWLLLPPSPEFSQSPIV